MRIIHLPPIPLDSFRGAFKALIQIGVSGHTLRLLMLFIVDSLSSEGRPRMASKLPKNRSFSSSRSSIARSSSSDTVKVTIGINTPTGKLPTMCYQQVGIHLLEILSQLLSGELGKEMMGKFLKAVPSKVRCATKSKVWC